MTRKRNRNNSGLRTRGNWQGPPVAVFWDQSLIWGWILVQTLQEWAVPHRLLTSEEIRAGALGRYSVLVVPGGWASHKFLALGEKGTAAIEGFVKGGGGYLGFCGGAGLALRGPTSLGLVPLERLGLAERLPNASGMISVRGSVDHPAWEGLPELLPVSIWWPSQFAWQPMPGMVCLASYFAPADDFWVADLPVRDLTDYCMSWEGLEAAYGINLNPTRLIGHPAILEARVGRGRVVLSYPHLETPGDLWGNELFYNLLAYLTDSARGQFPDSFDTHREDRDSTGPLGSDTLAYLHSIRTAFDDLIDFGERHLLWRWRNPWLLQWKRGIRGLEYGSLDVLARAVSELAENGRRVEGARNQWYEVAHHLHGDVNQFCGLAKRLLLEEKAATQSGALTKLGSVNEAVDELRTALFGRHMSHDGLSGRIFSGIDRVLFELIRPTSS